jgi:hypothetical protein
MDEHVRSAWPRNRADGIGVNALWPRSVTPRGDRDDSRRAGAECDAAPGSSPTRRRDRHPRCQDHDGHFFIDDEVLPGVTDLERYAVKPVAATAGSLLD